MLRTARKIRATLNTKENKATTSALGLFEAHHRPAKSVQADFAGYPHATHHDDFHRYVCAAPLPARDTWNSEKKYDI